MLGRLEIGSVETGGRILNGIQHDPTEFSIPHSAFSTSQKNSAFSIQHSARLKRIQHPAFSIQHDPTEFSKIEPSRATPKLAPDLQSCPNGLSRFFFLSTTHFNRTVVRSIPKLRRNHFPSVITIHHQKYTAALPDSENSCSGKKPLSGWLSSYYHY